MVLVYTTCKDTSEAVKLGNLLVKDKLAACVNIWPMQSMYLEEGQLKSQTEAVLLIKTLEHKLAGIEEVIEKNHSYSTPIVAGIEIKRLNRKYREWMTSQIH